MAAIDEIYNDLLFGLCGVKSCIYENMCPIKELLTLSENAQLDKITKIGNNFCEVKNFIDIINEGEEVGYYALKCAERIEKCLEPYCRILSDLRSEPACLTYLYSRIQPYSEIIAGLLLVVRELRITQSKGASILEILEKHYNASCRAVQLAIKYIYQGVSEQMIHHLKSWLLYGEISDSEKEFFIQENKSVNLSNAFESFNLLQTRVPSFIRPLVAERILNTGQTVLYLRSRPEKRMDPVGKEMSIDANGVSSLIAEKLTSKFEQSYKAVPMEQWKCLESITEEVAALATTQLHYLAMMDGGLVQQVHNIKDILLMGRGELFHEFVTQADVILSKGPTTFLDVNLLLRACARKVLMEEELLAPFTLEMVASGEGGQELNMKYSVPWPLELLFTQQVVGHYNHIFRFLLRLKRIQVRMVTAWLRDKRKRRLVSCSKRRRLQQNLWFLVNNVQYYLQVDVLESQFVTLEAAVIASDNFEDIRMAHARFLANLVEQSFLNSPQDPTDVINPVQQRLNNILMLCEEFCIQSERNDDDEMSADVVDCLTVKFDACFQRLFALLGALKRHTGYSGAQHLGQLLLRLDFNRFFSQKSIDCMVNL